MKDVSQKDKRLIRKARKEANQVPKRAKKMLYLCVFCQNKVSLNKQRAFDHYMKCMIGYRNEVKNATPDDILVNLASPNFSSAHTTIHSAPLPHHSTPLPHMTPHPTPALLPLHSIPPPSTHHSTPPPSTPAPLHLAPIPHHSTPVLSILPPSTPPPSTHHSTPPPSTPPPSAPLSGKKLRKGQSICPACSRNFVPSSKGTVTLRIGSAARVYCSISHFLEGGEAAESSLSAPNSVTRKEFLVWAGSSEGSIILPAGVQENAASYECHEKTCKNSCSKLRAIVLPGPAYWNYCSALHVLSDLATQQKFSWQNRWPKKKRKKKSTRVADPST
eukprot:TRINITY_DN171_c0_g2_i2.p1 TRINITY_DN171_c0_g2~~TRINITY_DN171_c0_g2_i2.p1  ORF type:complete len:331 (-),score=-57.36 TRINITY_DN171_c0_g2_i2:71-1063(-)